MKNQQSLRHSSGQAGFVLLMSSIVISSILVAVVFSLSFSGFFTRFNLLDSYNKESSLQLAEACGDIAVLKKIQDINYSGNEAVPIGSDSCFIFLVTSNIIDTTAKVPNDDGGAVSNIRIELDLSASPPAITRWREVETF